MTVLVVLRSRERSIPSWANQGAIRVYGEPIRGLEQTSRQNTTTTKVRALLSRRTLQATVE
jgi:hypothetical protein